MSLKLSLSNLSYHRFYYLILRTKSKSHLSDDLFKCACHLLQDQSKLACSVLLYNMFPVFGTFVLPQASLKITISEILKEISNYNFEICEHY